MEEAFVAELLATAGLTALVGQRVTWASRPQHSALPAVVLHMISGVPDVHMTGPSGLTESRIQIDCWGSSFAAAKGVARAVVPVVNGRAFTRSGVRFSSFMESQRDDFDGEPPETFNRTMLDVRVWHSPTA